MIFYNIFLKQWRKCARPKQRASHGCLQNMWVCLPGSRGDQPFSARSKGWCRIATRPALALDAATVGFGERRNDSFKILFKNVCNWKENGVMTGVCAIKIINFDGAFVSLRLVLSVRDMMTDIILNGRFLSKIPTGVDRVAEELATRLAQIQITQGQGFTVAVPKDAPPDASIRDRLHLVEDTKILRGRCRGYIWEQFELPWWRPKAILVSFANMGPLVRRNQAVMIHDAQVFDQPQSYSKAFRLAYHVLQPYLARRVRYLFTVSEYSKQKMIEHGLDPKGRAFVLPNGVDHFEKIVSDPSALDKSGLVKGEYFLAVGSLAPHKNIPFLARIFEETPTIDFPLVIVGGGNSAVFSSIGISEGPKVRLMGRATDGQLRALYEGARGLLFPSLSEGFGLPPLEAMLCGCPVIASSGGAIPEACGDAAILLDPSDSAAWAREISIFSNDLAKRSDLSMCGRIRAANFTWKETAQKCAQVLNLGDFSSSLKQ